MIVVNFYKFPYVLLIISIVLETSITQNREHFMFSDPSSCGKNESFNINLLKCDACKENFVQSFDGLSCMCRSGHKLVTNIGSGQVHCEQCISGEIPTSDGRQCLPCRGSCQACSFNQIRVDSQKNGSYSSDIHCLNCTSGMEPSVDGTRCVPCAVSLLAAGNGKCQCPTDTHEMSGGICIPLVDLANVPTHQKLFTVKYENGQEVDSVIFREHVRAAAYMCKVNKNSTACQLLANLCTLLHYNYDTELSACGLLRQLSHSASDLPSHAPWIYYDEEDGVTVLYRTKISATYDMKASSLNNRLNFTVARFLIDGTFLGMSVVSGSTFQLCQGAESVLSAAFTFGTYYEKSCKIPAKELWDKTVEFYDLYLQFNSGDAVWLYAVPVSVLNFNIHGNYKNKNPDRRHWQLVRRFYLIDNMSGKETVSGPDSSRQMQKEHRNLARVVRYVKSFKISIELRDQDNPGSIYPPLVILEYGEVTEEDYKSNREVAVRFSVDYQMKKPESTEAIEISIGVLSALAVIWAALQTWSWSRRAGRLAIDFFTLLKLMLYTCGNLSNVFMVVMFFTCLHWLIFFKRQDVVHVVLPNKEQDRMIRDFVISAFVLKVVEVTHLIAMQISVDIFLIDWERPRAQNSIPHPQKTQAGVITQQEAQPISIWRTYFVANEWNAVQSCRKINMIFQLFMTLFILKVLGFENLTSADPQSNFILDPDKYHSPYSDACRFAMGVSVYLVTAIIQWMFWSLFYERFVEDKIQQFVDLCSMSNISVFILASQNFGYYIHGRSAHGFADTDMQTMIDQLHREEEDLCGHRGLLPSTDHQTFQMALPPKLRIYYDKVLAPINFTFQQAGRLPQSGAGPGGGRGRQGGSSLERSVQAYHTMNKFLATFLEKALRDLDYEVRDKLFLENVLDMEFQESSEKGIFYNDNGHSFDAVLFYGNEFTLLTFDILMFSFVEILAHDYVLAVIITYVSGKILEVLRDKGGKKNLARKTIIDERFLM